jgi:malonyl-CoA decarboxylase
MRTVTEEASLFDRTLHRLQRAWSEISRSQRGSDEFSFSPELTDADIRKLQTLIMRSLDAPTGEVSARALAARIGESYMGLNAVGRERFIRLIARDFDVDDEQIDGSIKAYQLATDPQAQRLGRRKLRDALVPPRVRLLTLFNALPEGVKFLVDLRSELLTMGSRSDDELAAVQADLKELLESWFDIGFLKLDQVTWESPAALLEKLIEYEAVHEISNWIDLKHRLAPDRRLYAFFHPNMPGEPLIFVQVALVRGIADNIQSLLDTEALILDSHEADTAIFYSISNAQQGLAGISFGNFLIKQVVADLSKALPQIRQFSTLSPVPGFMNWLRARPEFDSADSFDDEARELLENVAETVHVAPTIGALLGVENWQISEQLVCAVQPPLVRLCAQYLNTLRDGSKRALDPVAHFHLSNGATLYQVNWLADNSEKGFKESAGLMVNYLYDLATIDANTQNYAEQGIVTTSAQIKELLGK